MYHICCPECQTHFRFIEKRKYGSFGTGGVAGLGYFSHPVWGGIGGVQHETRLAGPDGRFDLGSAEHRLSGLACEAETAEQGRRHQRIDPLAEIDDDEFSDEPLFELSPHLGEVA